MNKRSAEETRKNILLATRKVFAEHGYDRASMRAIAQCAGVSTGALYLYFRNREELYTTLMTEWMDELDSLTDQRLRSVTDPAAAVGAFITATIEVSSRRRDMILLQGREVFCCTDLKREFFRKRRLHLAAIIGNGIKRGIFAECDAEEAAKVIFSMLRGYIVSMVVEEEALFSPDACVSLVLKGLTRRKQE